MCKFVRNAVDVAYTTCKRRFQLRFTADSQENPIGSVCPEPMPKFRGLADVELDLIKNMFSKECAIATFGFGENSQEGFPKNQRDALRTDSDSALGQVAPLSTAGKCYLSR